VKFVKMQGLGNDFVVIEGPVTLTESQVAAMCDRRSGIGADGVLVVTPGGPAVRMDYWNADGSAAEMCGNGLRCVARFAVDRGWAGPGPFSVETTVGILEVAMLDDETARVEIGSAEVGESLQFRDLEFVRVSVGNPHAVTFVDNTSAAPVEGIGPDLETSTDGGTNVEFAHIGGGAIEVRTWERGCGETLACGTGAVAVAAAARDAGMAGDRVVIRLLGGDLIVEFDNDRAWITGPAHYSFEGVWSARPVRV